MAESPKKGASFRGLYIILGLILLAIFAAAAVGKLSMKHGVKGQGERCVTSEDCLDGYICYSYQNAPNICHQTCYGQACSPGLECVSIAEQRGRRSTRVRNICVEHIVTK